MKVFFTTFPKNKYIKFAVWGIIFLILLAAITFMKTRLPDIAKEDVLKAVQNTQSMTDYRWHITSDISFKGIKNTISDVTGERNKESVSLKGTFLKTPIELVQIKNVTYRLDPLTNQWLIIKDNTMQTEEVLNTELNPVAALKFSAISSFKAAAIDEINNEKVYRIQLQPEVDSKYLTQFWQDFDYVIWIDKDLEYVVGFELTAKSRQDPTGMIRMKVIFNDFGEKINIRAPL